jgi:hypothetical protein
MYPARSGFILACITLGRHGFRHKNGEVQAFRFTAKAGTTDYTDKHG